MRQPPPGNAGICNAEDPPSALREEEIKVYKTFEFILTCHLFTGKTMRLFMKNEFLLTCV